MPGQDTLSHAGTRFLLDDRVISVNDAPPWRTVLQFLREDLRRTGTREGCAEGDCGACTAVIVELDDDDRLRVRPVNTCIQLLPTLDGRALITVESLSDGRGGLHPVQRAMIEGHASQCGFCTPGFVMSLFALYKTQARPDRAAIDEALSGNLCRCTGYRPIVDAAVSMYETDSQSDRWITRPAGAGNGPAEDEVELIAALRAIRRPSQPAETLADGRAPGNGTGACFLPRTLAEASAYLAAHPHALAVAGGTDVGLRITKALEEPQPLVFLHRVRELRRIEHSDDGLVIGAAVPLSDLQPLIRSFVPAFDELFRRFASPPIRNVATLGGNIANGSPIGDSMPALLCLDAVLLLRRGHDAREVSLDAFYTGYREHVLQPGELIEAIRIPRPGDHARIGAFKLSRRYDQDISAVCCAMCVEVRSGVITRARVAYGGMADTPQRAHACERALLGRPWDEATVATAMAALDTDYAPIDDVRASATYRRLAARNLLWRFFLDNHDGPANDNPGPGRLHGPGR